MPEQLPWFPFYVRDFVRSRLVRSAPPEHIGIYVLLLCEQWEEGPLPDDTDAMAGLIGVDGEAMSTAWQSLKSRFEKTEDGWVNSRLVEVRKEQEKKHRIRSRAGKKGAKARWNKGNDGKRMANASGSHGTANATAMQEKEEEQEETKPPIVPLWEIWLEEFGGSGKQPTLTNKRRKKIAALYEEQLEDADDHEREMRRICKAVKKSDHHMSERSYQMPESLFRNAERRDRWMMKAQENGKRQRKRLHLTPEQVVERYADD